MQFLNGQRQTFSEKKSFKYHKQISYFQKQNVKRLIVNTLKKYEGQNVKLWVLKRPSGNHVGNGIGTGF